MTPAQGVLNLQFQTPPTAISAQLRGSQENWLRALLAIGLTITLCCALSARPAQAADAEISIELNKLENKDKSCRTYVLVNNSSETAYTNLTLDLVMFRTDGIMDRRLALKLAPLRKTKRSLKLFDLSGVACDQIGSFLINDVMECSTKDGPVEDCLSKLSVSSRAAAKLTK